MKQPASGFLRFALPLATLFALAGCTPTGDGKSPAADPAKTPAPAEVNLLVGTYTEGPASSGKSKGIPVFRFDTTTGETRLLATNDGIRNPSWLVVSKDAKFAYSVNELNGTGKSGEVSAFDFDAKSGRLNFINKVSSEGDDPCHLMLDEEANLLFVSNYSSGTAAALTVAPETRALGRAEWTMGYSVRHSSGTGETKPHIHSFAAPLSGNPVVMQNLGFDELTVFQFGRKTVTDLSSKAGASIVRLPAGTGPRHLIFDTPKNHAYLIGELNDSVTVMNNNMLTGEWSSPLAPAQTVTLGATPAPGNGTAAAIHLSDDGRFLYASVRNPKNILAVFAVNPADGKLTEIQTVSSGGKAPREFAIAPGGKFLLVANQQSDALAVFSRDTETGKITDTGRRIPVGTPVDLKWAPAR